MKEGLEEDLDRLKSRKDDMLTIAEIGVDQLIVDEMQEFRKLSFATNQTTLKGIDPDGSQRAWDLYVKTRFIDATKNPGRALVAASGTPITNSLAELFTLQRFIQPDALQERGIQEFDAWAANFGETRTELELQPSGLYKPVTRFCEFVNVPDLMAIYRMATDVVLKSDLRQYLKLPAIAEGVGRSSPRRRAKRSSPTSVIWPSGSRRSSNRQSKPQKGDDILLSVITDGRHAAIDLRFVRSRSDNEPDNKLNALIDNVHRIWEQTANNRYTRSDGIPYALPGAAQMIFSDLGTLAAEETRGFSAYRWIKDSLVARGVPSAQIAFMQDYKKSSAKQRLFNAVNGGQVRILIGSVRDHGHRRQRPATAESAPPSRRAVAPLPDRTARGPDRAAGQRERGDRDLRLRDEAQRRRHWLADPRTEGPLHRRRHGGRSQRPPDRGRRLASEPVRARQGDRLRRRAAHAQGWHRL